MHHPERTQFKPNSPVLQALVSMGLLLTGLVLCAPLVPANPGDMAASYLPLRTGLKWVLRSSSENKPAIFEVLREEGNEYVIRSSTPWSSTDWALTADADRYLMTRYGTGGAMMPLPNRPEYLDFGAEPGTQWTSSLGKFHLATRSAEVQTAARTYEKCVRIIHRAGRTDLAFTYARGVGYVEFGTGGKTFVLDETASVLPFSGPSGTLSSKRDTTEGRRLPVPLIGITPNRFAGEPMTAEVMSRHFQDTVVAGVTFLVGNGKWAEIERRPGTYDFAEIRQLLSAAAGAHLPISFTLRAIDTIARDLPGDLRGKAWTDPEMERRVSRLLDEMVPLIRGRVRWFMFGYEVDGYLEHRPDEIDGFSRLFAMVKAKVRSLAPEIQVGTTFSFAGSGRLENTLKPLYSQTDILALTYCPLNPDFTVEEPSVVRRDFPDIGKVAEGRLIVFQEIGYPTSAAAHSSQELQAEFYRQVFEELTSPRSTVAAANLMTLADLGEDDSRRFASFYGLPRNEAFRGTLQSLGFFDDHGGAKKSWAVVTEGIRRLKRE